MKIHRWRRSLLLFVMFCTVGTIALAETNDTISDQSSNDLEITSGTTESINRQDDDIEVKRQDNIKHMIVSNEQLEPFTYIKLINQTVMLWNKTLDNTQKLTTLKGTMYLTKDKLMTESNDMYYSIYDKQDKFLGYMNTKDGQLVEHPEGNPIKYNQYITISNQGFIIYSDFNQTEKINHDAAFQDTFLAKEKFEHASGVNYLALYNDKNQFVGYINKTDTTEASGKQGMYIPFGKYVTITQKNESIWRNFNWTLLQPSKNVFGKTFLAKGEYHHVNGKIYYSIYDSNAKWQGYVESSNVQVASGPEGSYQSTNKYVSIVKNNYSIWKNFSWHKMNTSQDIFKRTFLVKGMYQHYSGGIYYSLYDTKGTWYGYINAQATKAVSSENGEYQQFGQYMTITSHDYDTLHNFSGKILHSNSKVLNQTYQARGKYENANGTTYYSLYNKSGTWMGYIPSEAGAVSSGGQGAYQHHGKHVTVTRNNYILWRNFGFKNKMPKTTNYSGKTLLAKGKYNHYNGYVYYSLYDNQNKWLGYINANDVALAPGPEGIYQSFWKQVVVTSPNYTMWSNFSWNAKGKSHTVFNQTLMARGRYQHFSGATYYSLYDAKGNWLGYINSTGTRLKDDKIKKVQNLLNRKYNNGNFGISVMSLTDGTTAGINANKQFTAASTGKLPALYYTQKMIHENKKNAHTKHQYTDAINNMTYYSYMRGGAGILQGKPYGTYYSLDQMMNWTAKYSDNQGANFLGYYGSNKYDTTMRHHISSIIGRQWNSPFLITARENALLMEAIYRQNGQLVSYLQHTVYDQQRIPKYLPVKVAHKIGDVGVYRHDVAIVYAKEPYVLSIMTQYSNYEVISQMSKDIYDIMK